MPISVSSGRSRQAIIRLAPDRVTDSLLLSTMQPGQKQVLTATTAPNPAINNTVSIGTPGYMPDEQCLGNPKLASDIYAVGAIGIQCLTGVAPENLLDKDSRILEWQRLRLIDRDFTTVLNKMLAPDHWQRYVNANEALQAIESLISPSIPTQVPPPIPIPTPVISTAPTKPVIRYPPPQLAACRRIMIFCRTGLL
jgi:serine/threonine protein kinase